MKIYVGNFDYNLTEDDLKAAFLEYGTVDTVTIITDRGSGRSKGFGFVEMPEKEQAQAAIDGLNGTTMGDRTITVSEARPKPAGGGGRGGFGGGGGRGGFGGGGGRGGGGGGRGGGGRGGGGRGGYGGDRRGGRNRGDSEGGGGRF